MTNCFGLFLGCIYTIVFRLGFKYNYSKMPFIYSSIYKCQFNTSVLATWLNLKASCSSYMQCMDDVHLQLSISKNIAVFGSVYVLSAHAFPQRRFEYV